MCMCRLTVRALAAIAFAAVTFLLVACGGGSTGARGTLSPVDGNQGNLPPVFAPGTLPPDSGDVGILYTYQALATDADTGTLAWTLTQHPAGMEVSVAGLVEWTPVPGQAGNHVVTLTVSDGVAVAALDWVIIVSAGAAPPSSAPLITTYPVTHAEVGQPYSYQITAFGSPAPAILVSGHPWWLQFDDTTSTLLSSGPPAPGGVTGTITITASNSAGTDEQIFAITVDDPNLQTDFVASLDIPQEGAKPSLAIDSQGTAMIAYYDNASRDLLWATNKLGTWASGAAIDSQGDVGLSPSMALDSKGWAHIAYYDLTNGRLKYATNSVAAGTWITGVVDYDARGPGYYASLAIDLNDNVHIAYHASGNTRELRYAVNTNLAGVWPAAWVIETVDGGGEHASLVLDPQGKAHVAYRTNVHYGSIVPYRLKYTTNATGTWVSNVVDGNTETQRCGAIAIDSGGQAHIAYQDAKDDSVKYAFKPPFSASWTLEGMDTGLAGYGDISLGIDTSGRVQAIYACYDGTRDFEVRHATRVQGIGWIFETLAPTGFTTLVGNLVDDGNGRVSVAYCDHGTGAAGHNAGVLKYTWRTY